MDYRPGHSVINLAFMAPREAGAALDSTGCVERDSWLVVSGRAGKGVVWNVDLEMASLTTEFKDCLDSTRVVRPRAEELRLLSLC